MSEKTIDFKGLTIRTVYKPGDMAYMLYMHSRFYDFGFQFEMYVAESLLDFVRNLDSEKECIWIAEDKEKIVGTIALKHMEGKAQLRYFLIDPDYRGRGLGRFLINQFMGFLKKSDYRSSFLLTEDSLDTALHLYKSYGFSYVSSRDTDFGLVESRYELAVE
ncbi:MAG: GNAT family N-acetyltransferase [Cyclobacteriaceae bacterium]